MGDSPFSEIDTTAIASAVTIARFKTHLRAKMGQVTVSRWGKEAGRFSGYVGASSIVNKLTDKFGPTEQALQAAEFLINSVDGQVDETFTAYFAIAAAFEEIKQQLETKVSDGVLGNGDTLKLPDGVTQH